MKDKKGFTLAEALITLGILGVVATVAIPSVISNHKQAQYKTGLKKAVKTLNEAISMNIAKGEKSALKTDSLFEYLQKNIEVIRSTTSSSRNSNNSQFITNDGMIYEVPNNNSSTDFQSLKVSDGTIARDWAFTKANCGTYGLGIGGSSAAQAKQPCIVLVDVNGNRVPNVKSSATELGDMFLILITDKSALPYGDLAQKAYYGE